MENTNAYVRTWCTLGWCAHKYALYFEKDQTRGGEIAGHRNDLEHIIVWVKDDVVRYVATSAHGDYTVRSAKAVRFDDTHPKIVYHKDGLTTHAFRFATGGDAGPSRDHPSRVRALVAALSGAQRRSATAWTSMVRPPHERLVPSPGPRASHAARRRVLTMVESTEPFPVGR